MNEWYLVATASAVALAVVTPPLWRWCAGVDKPKDEPEDDYPNHPRNDEAFAALNERAANFRRLTMWRNRVKFHKRELAKELRMKRGRIGAERAALNDATAQVLKLEGVGPQDATAGTLNPIDPAIRLAMLTGSVTSDPADPS
jgi:hypothetical protein